jgi:hypothetical protein
MGREEAKEAGALGEPGKQRPIVARRSCLCRLRINLPGSPVTHRRGKKACERGLSWPPSGPLSPGEAVEASRVDAPRRLRPPPLAASHHPGWLTTPRAAATAVPETAAPRVASRRDPSAQRPWRASVAASAWPSLCHASAQPGAEGGVSSRAVSKNYSTRDTRPAAGVRRPRPCTAWRPSNNIAVTKCQIGVAPGKSTALCECPR